MEEQPNPAVVAFLRHCIVKRSGIPESALGNDMSLVDLGVTSLDAVLISGEVEDHFDIEVDPILMFEHRSINSFARHLSAMLPVR